MFDTFLAASGSRWQNARKALTFSLSLLFHAVLVAAVIVVPLLRAETQLPEYAVIDASLMAPPVLPGIPPAGRPRDEVTKPGAPADEGEKHPRHHGADFTVPTEISKSTDEVLNFDLSDSRERIGVEGGIDLEGETGEWEIGREYIPEAVTPGKGPVLTITPPRLAKRVNPNYPTAAILARVSGPVVIEAVTDIYGRVKETRVIGGHPLLNAAALEAVREWIYEPYLINGIPKPVRFTVTVTFTLDRR